MFQNVFSKALFLISLCNYLRWSFEKDTDYIIVKTGESVELSCVFDDNNIVSLVWSYLPTVENRERYIYYTDENNTRPNYKVHCEYNQSYCNLTLLRASSDSAGLYRCKTGKSLIFPTTVTFEVELIVGDLKCNSNINSKQSMIGENDCTDIDADMLQRSCSFNYTGNPNIQLNFTWMANGTQGLISHLTEYRNDTRVDGNSKSLTFRDEVEIMKSMHESVSGCFIEDHPILGTCELPTMRITYVKRLNEKYFEMNFDELHDVKCSLDTSKDVNCSYTWEYKSDIVTTKIHYPVLTKQEIKSTGLFTCFAECNISATHMCSITVAELNVVQSQSKALKIAIILVCIIISLLAAVAVIGFCLYKRNSSIKFKNESIGLLPNNEEKKDELNSETDNFPMDKDLKLINLDVEQFSYSEPFTDEDCSTFVDPSLAKRFSKWVRVSELLPDKKFFVLQINEQDLIENSIFFNLTLQHERKFQKKIISNMIYPQNKRGQTLYNPSGKYVGKFYLNGEIQKIIIDDKLPVDESGNLLCSFYKDENRFFLSLLEKAYNKFLVMNELNAQSTDNLQWITGWIPFRYYTHDKYNLDKIINEYLKGNCLIFFKKHFRGFAVLMDIQKNKTGIKLQYVTLNKLNSENESNFDSIEDCMASWKKEHSTINMLWNPGLFVYKEFRSFEKSDGSDCRELNLSMDTDDNEKTMLLFLSRKYENWLDNITMLVRNANPYKKENHSIIGDFIELKVYPGHDTFNVLIHHLYDRHNKQKSDYNINIYSNARFTLKEHRPYRFSYEENKLDKFPFFLTRQISQARTNRVIVSIQEKYNIVPKEKLGKTKLEKITKNDSNEEKVLIEEKYFAPGKYCCFYLENISEEKYKFSFTTDDENYVENKSKTMYNFRVVSTVKLSIDT